MTSTFRVCRCIIHLHRNSCCIDTICSFLHIHNSVLSSFLTYHWVCNKGSTAGVTCGAGTAYPSGAPELIPGFHWVRVARSLVFYVVFCTSFLSLFPFFIITLSVLLRFTVFDYTFGNFKPFFENEHLNLNLGLFKQN